MAEATLGRVHTGSMGSELKRQRPVRCEHVIKFLVALESSRERVGRLSRIVAIKDNGVESTQTVFGGDGIA